MNTTASIATQSAWPCMDICYFFVTENSSPAINIIFSFDAAAYRNPSVDTEAKIIADLLFYQNLKISIESKEITINYTTGIEAATDNTPLANSITLSDVLEQLIQPVITFLESLIPKPELGDNIPKSELPPPQPFVLLQAINADAQKNTTNVFKLNTELIITNTVTNNTTTQQIKPQSLPDEGFDLQLFAQQTEDTFANFTGTGSAYKIAADASSNSKIPAMWVLKTDPTGKSGIKIEVGTENAAFFAPIPLNNSLQNFNTTHNTYETGKPYPTGQIISTNFSGIDLTLWAGEFFAVFDAVLSPEYAKPIAFLKEKGEISIDYIAGLTALKQQLAKAVSKSAESIIANPTSQNAISIAQQQWQQVLTQNLSVAYNNTIGLQWPATITQPGNTTEGLLYGAILADDATINTDFSLGFIPLQNGATALAFSATAFPNFDYSPIAIPAAAFVPQYLSVSGNTTLLPFVIPFKDTIELSPVNAPLPNYAVPTSLSVTSQSATDSTVIYPNGAMPTAFTWNYNSGFDFTSQVGDVITVNVNLNNQDSENQLIETNNNALRQPLAECISVLPQLTADFEKHLITLTPENIDKQGSNASFALQAFATVANNVVQKWDAQTHQQQSVSAQSASSIAFDITQQKQEGTGILLVSITNKNETAAQNEIALNIEGFTTLPVENTTDTFEYKAADGSFLLWENRNTFNNYTLTLEGFNILNIINANSAYQTVRNVDLVQGEATNTPFLLNGGQTEFSYAVDAFINYPQAINMALLLGTDSFELVQYINAFFNQLFANTVSQQHIVGIKIGYDYTIQPIDIVTSVPVTIVPPTTVSNNDDAFNTSLSQTLTNWFSIAQPSLENAKFTFDLTVYTDTNTPLLQMQAYLPIDKIKNL
jgi:hypothetical protein